jgi:hypothetical protein
MAIVTRAVLPNEPDLLKGKEHQTLVFTDLDANILYAIHAPSHGWSHEGLDMAAWNVRDDIQQDGWDAYLGAVCSENWIGSSEV